MSGAGGTGAGSGGFGFGNKGGGGGGFPGGGFKFENMMGGMPNFGGMGGGGQPKQQERTAPTVSKNDPSGLVPLGKSKFPDVHATHPWLILFYDKIMLGQDPKTEQYMSEAKQVSEGVLKKAKNIKNGMVFKVGAVDCNGDALRFCQSKLGKGVELPAFATVLNGSVSVVTDDSALQNAKKLHDHTTDSLLKIEGLVLNVNSAQHIQSRLFASSPIPGHPSIAILLLTDKYDTSPLYASLAYRHRQDGFAAFGESRGKNLQLAKQFSVKKHPTLLALIDNDEKVERYSGASLDLESLSTWINGLSKRYFNSQPGSDSKRKSQRARA